MSDLADVLSLQLKSIGIAHEREKKLIPGRKFRTDIFVAPDLAIECDGGTWNGGRHARGSGIETDCEKQNLLVTLGYRPMRFTRKQITLGHAEYWIQEALKVAKRYELAMRQREGETNGSSCRGSHAA